MLRYTALLPAVCYATLPAGCCIYVTYAAANACCNVTLLLHVTLLLCVTQLRKLRFAAATLLLQQQYY